MAPLSVWCEEGKERSLVLAPWEISVCFSLPPWKWGPWPVSWELWGQGMRSTDKMTEPHHLRALRRAPVFL